MQSPESHPDRPPHSLGELARRILVDAGLDAQLDLQRLSVEARLDLQRTADENARQLARMREESARELRVLLDPAAWLAALRSAANDAIAGVQQKLSDPDLGDQVNGFLSALVRATRDGLKNGIESMGRAADEANKSELGILVEHLWLLPGGIGSVITLVALDRRDESRSLTVLEHAIRDPEYLDILAERIKSEGILTGPQEERVMNGLDALKSPGTYWTAPRDALHLAVENMIWHLAASSGVIDEDRRPLVSRQGLRRPILSAKALIVNSLLPLRDPTQLYFRTRVFDAGRSDDARHARQHESNRRYALYALIGILALFDQQAGASDAWALRSLCERLKEPLSMEFADQQEEFRTSMTAYGLQGQN